MESESESENNYIPAWVREQEEEDIFGREVEEEEEDVDPLQYEDISDEDLEPADPPEDITWDGDHTFFFPEAEDFEDPPAFIADPFITARSSPFDILKMLLSDEVIHEILLETNRYARQQRIRGWKDLSEREWWIFLALHLLMGLIRKPTLKDYWTKDPLLNTPYFGELMSRNRFEEILRALHFVDNEDPTINRQDRFHKLGKILPLVLNNFRKLVNPGEFLTIDEQLMPYKGRLSFRQYSAKKAAKFGIKCFLLLDKEHRYIVDILPYQGKSTGLDPSLMKQLGFGGGVVVTLLGKGFLDRKHRVIVDNYFNSPTLCKYLVHRNTFTLGTVRKDRKLMPEFTGKLKKGDVQTASDGDLLVERWRDSRDVYILNSFIEHRMEVTGTQDPDRQKTKPASVLVYNNGMGSLDDVDKITRPYQALRRTKKWYKKFAFHLFDMSVYNAFVLFNHFRTKSTRYTVFLKNLIKEIIARNPIERSTRGRPALRPRNCSLDHYPRTIEGRNGKSQRSNCQMCSKSKKRTGTATKCSTCNVWLCTKGEVSCFAKYHEALRKKGSSVQSAASARMCQASQHLSQLSSINYVPELRIPVSTPNSSRSQSTHSVSLVASPSRNQRFQYPQNDSSSDTAESWELEGLGWIPPRTTTAASSESFLDVPSPVSPLNSSLELSEEIPSDSEYYGDED